MKCAKARELLLTDYIDGRLDGDAADEVRDHLAVCPACRAVEEEIKGTVAPALRNLPVKEAPYLLWENIKDRISDLNPRRRPSIFRILRPAFLVPVLAMILFALIFLFRPGFIDTGNNLDAYLEEQAEFVSNGGIDEMNGGGFGTTIEEFFL